MARGIDGLAQTMQILKKFEPDAYKQMQKRMKSDAKPMLQDAKSRLPQVPLSNWKPPSGAEADSGGVLRHGGAGRVPAYVSGAARKNVRLSLRNQKDRGGRRVVLKMVSKDAAAIVFDAAGKRTSSVFAQNLSNLWGGPMRALWPAAEEHKGEVLKSISASLREQETKTNRQLRWSR